MMSRFKEQDILNTIISTNANLGNNSYHPLVSIVVTSHSRPKYIEELFNTISGQSFKDFEVIVWDDGSDERTHEVLKKWNKRDGRFKYIIFEKRNTGIPNRGRNLGILLSSGRYICFIDDDNKYKPTFVEEMLKSLKNTPCGISYCIYDVINSDGRPLNRLWQFGKRKGKTLSFQEISKSNSIDLAEVLLNKEILIRSGIFDERVPALMDWDLWIRVFNQCQVTSTWNTLGSIRINHSGRITGNSNRYLRTPRVGNAYNFIRNKKHNKKLDVVVVGVNDYMNYLSSALNQYDWISVRKYALCKEITFSGVTLLFIDSEQIGLINQKMDGWYWNHINTIPVFKNTYTYPTPQQTILFNSEGEQKIKNIGCTLDTDNFNYNKFEWFLSLLQGFSKINLDKIWVNQ